MAVSVKSFLFLVLVLHVFENCFAHLCLISPPQRGSITGINKKAAPDCGLETGPCGGRPAQGNGIILRQGQNFTVTFQKNLNHWTKSSPGYFKIAFGAENQFRELVRIPDGGEQSLTLYSVNVTMPTSERLYFRAQSPQILQVTYVTGNPQAPPVFYQCSDVTLIDGYGRKRADHLY